MTHHRIALSEVTLHCVIKGQGPLVILLHGFPDFWYSWRHQIPALANAGYRVVAPDLRGYNLSSKPEGIASYDLEHLTRDIKELIEALGETEAVVIGHDWGAIIAWQFAMDFPQMIRKLGILNVPHPDRFIKGLVTTNQLLKSWYVFVFQLPWLPESLIRADDYRALRTLLKNDPVRPDAFTAEDIERYVEAFAQPGALTSAINYYRAIMRRYPRKVERSLKHIQQPVLIIWGEQDRYLSKELAMPNPELVPHVRLERLPQASHWVHHDDPVTVNELLVTFLQASQNPAVS